MQVYLQFTVVSLLVFYSSGMELLKTHYTQEEYIGYQNISVEDFSVTIKGLNTSVQVKLYRSYITKLSKLFTHDSFTDINLEPANSSLVKLVENIDSIATTLVEINNLLKYEKRRTITRREIESTCKLQYTLNPKPLNALTNSVYFILTTAKSLIDAGRVNAATFQGTDGFNKLVTLLTAGEKRSADYLASISLFKISLEGVKQQKIDLPTKQYLLKDECLQAKTSVRTEITINNCRFTNLIISCHATLTKLDRPLVIYKLMPYIYNTCYVDKIIYLDSLRNPYMKNDQNDLLTPMHKDECLQGLIDLNKTVIMDHCPLSRSNLLYERTKRGIVIHKLNENLIMALHNVSIENKSPPFLISGGNYDIKIGGGHYHFNFRNERRIYNPILPFKATHLCPKKSKHEAFSFGMLKENALSIVCSTLSTLMLLLSGYITLGVFQKIKKIRVQRPNNSTRNRRTATEHNMHLLLDPRERATSRR